MVKDNNIYLAGIVSIIPAVYPLSFIIDALYPVKLASENIRRFAMRIASFSSIENKPSILDFSAIPHRKLLYDDYKPQSWGNQILNKLSKDIVLSDIGYLGVSYDVSSHQKKIPNLACQIAIENNLNLVAMPEEYAYYGCGSGLLALKSAMDFCSKYSKAAIVFSFSQCSWLCDPIYDAADPYFKHNLKATILFGDGAVGMLLMPQSMMNYHNKKLLKILDIQVGFMLGEKIKMTDEGRFLVDDTIKNIIPDHISKELIIPMLMRNRLNIWQVEEWSLHQGGINILERFGEKDILGLTQDQLSNSMKWFKKYGNLSTVSSFMVLSDFFNEITNKNRYGILASFGAGYYYGAMLYESINA